MSARLLLIGPPGAGKGTQAHRLSQALGVPAISTGDIFRAHLRDETPLGRQAKAFMDAGDNVPDSLTNDLVRDRLSQPDAAEGFLLDGYPRTIDQVRALDELLSSHGHALDAVLRLVADQDEIVRRLRKRAIEQGRADDSEEAIRHRQEVYRRDRGAPPPRRVRAADRTAHRRLRRSRPPGQGRRHRRDRRGDRAHRGGARGPGHPVHGVIARRGRDLPRRPSIT